MNTKNKILSSILSATIVSSGFAGAFSFPHSNFYSYGASSDFVSIGQSSVLGVSSYKEYQVEGFELLRVVGLESNSDNKILHFRHEKTGAQVVVFVSSSNEDNIEVFFRAPSENHKGTIHILEHCVLSPLLFGEKDCFNGATNPVTVSYETERLFEHGSEKKLSNLLRQIKNPDFKNQEIDEKTRKHIFEIESYYEHTNKEGKVFKRGRVYHEEKRAYPLDSDNLESIITSSSMKQNSKQKFISGGLPADVPKVTYEEVCEAYEKYMHPSNSLIYISGNNWKDTMRILRDEYLNEYEKKEFDISYNIDNPSEIVRFSKHKIKNKAKFEYSKCSECNSKYIAKIGYFLKNITDEELDVFRVMKNNINNKNSNVNKILRSKGFLQCNLNIEAQDNHPYIELNLYGDNKECFSEEILKATAKDIIVSLANEDQSMFKNVDLCSGFSLYKCMVIKNVLINGFVFFNDPFSKNLFTIKDGKITDREFMDVTMDRAEFLSRFTDGQNGELRDPDEIMVLERDELDSKESEETDREYNFKINGLLNDGSCLDRIVFEVLKRNIVVPYIQKEGLVYNKILKGYYNKFQPSEKSTVPGLIDFFENDFPEIVRDFEVTQEMLERSIDAVSMKIKEINEFKESDEYKEMVASGEYKEYETMTTLVTRENLEAVTIEEVQNMIRGLSVSYVE